jgi:transposase-like protein
VGALERGSDPGYADFKTPVLHLDVVIARRTDGIARKLRQGPPRPDGRWHLDEVFVSINGRQLYVWRAVNSEGEVLDILVQPGKTARQRSS